MKSLTQNVVIAIVCIAIGFGVRGFTAGPRAEAQPEQNLDAPLPGSRGHFELSSYATQNGWGCYVIDSSTGTLWQASDGKVKRVAEVLTVR